jgi:hypothetical protein
MLAWMNSGSKVSIRFKYGPCEKRSPRHRPPADAARAASLRNHRKLEPGNFFSRPTECIGLDFFSIGTIRRNCSEQFFAPFNFSVFESFPIVLHCGHAQH